MKVTVSPKNGFTLIEIMVVVAVIGLLAGISTPSFLKARDQSQLSAIINNLRMIEQSKEQWALANRQGNGATPTDTDIAPYFRGSTMPALVVNETYNINPIGTPATATVPNQVGTVPPGGDVTLP